MKKVMSVSVCIMSWVVLLIHLLLFYNVALAADELNTSPRIIYGSNLNSLLSWGALFLMLLICILTTVFAVKSFAKRKYYY